MKIALIGYGKMGKTIENIAISRGHEIVLKITSSNAADLTVSNVQKADVAIEFSRPDLVLNNLEICRKAEVPVVCGTTGWIKDLASEQEKFSTKGALFYASNFSLGVNIFFQINKQLARMMASHDDYTAVMEEIHHVHKLDSPSGTGITLAQCIIAEHPKYQSYHDYPNQIDGTVPEHTLPIVSKRIGEVPGTHSIRWKSPVDQITIAHEAFGRQGFALGAVIAAEWIKDKKGVYGMEDLLRLS
jgi:4-hydroxy-tetrahydrodipicolinate reductase